MKLMLRIGVLAAYAAMPALQSFHLAHEAEHAVCAACAAEHAGEIGNSVRCAGGCGESGHHHHESPHRHDDCAVCKAAGQFAVSIGLSNPAFGPAAIPAGGGEDSRTRADVRRSHRSRAPPQPG